MPESATLERDARVPAAEPGASLLRARVETLERRLHQRDEQRRAMLHIMSDLNESNKRLANQRKAMLHILGDYEQDRRRLGHNNERLEASRKAMIHIMGDLRDTTVAVERREQELREKQELLIQAGKLATLGELTTGVAHELNNPLNNIGLFVGNAVDLVQLGGTAKERIIHELSRALQQVRKATEIISHLRTFGRAAPSSRDPVSLTEVLTQALSLMQEQLRLRDILVTLELGAQDAVVLGNALQLEQVFINLLTNARDALAGAPRKGIRIALSRSDEWVEASLADTGPGIPPGQEQRIFDPFFTTKDVGQGTGLGLSITYGIIKELGGTIRVLSPPGEGATFIVRLPLAAPATPVSPPS